MTVSLLLKQRSAVGVIVKVSSTSDDVINVLADYFSSQLGSRGSMLREMDADKKVLQRNHIRVYPSLSLVYGAVDQEGYRNLRKHIAVKAVWLSGAPRQIRSAASSAFMFDEAIPSVGSTWGIRAMMIEELWARGLTGKGVLIGHIDTGIDANHPVFEGAIESMATVDATGVLKKVSNISTDVGFHGTHTAATIVGRAHKGVKVGVAPGAKLISVRATDDLGDATARTLAAIEWTKGFGVPVLNMSFSLSGDVKAQQAILKILRSDGCLPVGAIGNYYEGFATAPAICDECLSVGALEQNGRIAESSSSDKAPDGRIVPDIVAPGADIYSARAGGGFMLDSGTSMATPHISGLAALLLEACPKATPLQLDSAIQRSAVLPPGASSIRGGRGLPNGPKALDILINMVK